MRNRWTLALFGAALGAFLALPLLVGCGPKQEEPSGGGYFTGQMKGKAAPGGAPKTGGGQG
jgi:hypothetical protein